MIIGIIKYIFFMIIFYFFIKIISYILKFILFFKKNNFNISKEDNLNNTLKMLQCENCKIYVAKSDAYIHNGKIFCKKEHVL